MKVEDCYQLGEVIKTHGLQGEVSVGLDVDFPEDYRNLESVFLLENGKLVPFFIDTIQINQNRALIKFEDVDSIESASPLVKSPLYLPLSFLQRLPEGSYYFHDLVGCEVYEKENSLGTVKEIIDLSGNQLLTVVNGAQEILIPMKDEIMKKVDIKSKKIEVELPDGLLDLYTS